MSRANTVTPRDRQRLAIGASAAANPNATREELCDAICALQSIDDLGSEEANDAAWNQMLALQERLKLLKRLAGSVT